MSYQPAKIEPKWQKHWEKEQTFQASLDNRKNGKIFSFYDGPPFANGTPHYGHLEQTDDAARAKRYAAALHRA